MKAQKTITLAAIVAANLAATNTAYSDTPGDRNFGFNFEPNQENAVFYSYRGDARPDIYVRGTNGNEKNLTARAETWDIEPHYSPDGRTIIYASGPNMGMLSLRIMNADGSEDRVFYDGDDNEVAPKWSPDGTRVIFSAFNRDAKTNIVHIAHADGSHVHSLTADLPGQSSNGSWSPDSQWILFSNKLGDTAQADIYRMRPDGSHRERLTNDALSQTSPVYSPDMKTIIFIGYTEAGQADLYAMPANGLHHGATPTKLGHSSEGLKYFLEYTPDGKQLIFSLGDWDKGFEMAHIAAPE